jgi:glycosyltransferase involved in cell wall biosynthesis
MRIGFDAKRLFNNFTGLGNYSRFLVGALVDHFPTNHYTLYSPKVRPHPDTNAFRVNPKLTVRTPPKWVKGSGFGSFWRSVNLGNIAFREGTEILHGLSNELPVTKPNGLKTVVTIHDLIFIRYPELYKRIDVAIYKKKLKRACASADRIIAISEQTARDLQDYMNVSGDRIKVIYQGCNTIFKQSVDSSEKIAIREKYNLPTKYILNVGTLERRKNALLILQALTQLPSEMALVLVGKETSYQKDLDEFIADNGLSPRVHFVNQIDFTDLPAIYQESEVFVYPSRFEGFGIPIIEAVHSGVPVIAASGSCLEEAGGGGGIYIDPDDSESLAEEIKKLLSNSSYKEEKIINARAHVEKFEPAKIAGEVFNLYREILA